MKHFTFDNHWDEIKGQLKQRYGQLTDDDLTFAEGKGEELMARLSQKLGVSEDELTDTMNDLHLAAGGRLEQARQKTAEVAGEVRARATAAAGEVKSRATAAAGEVKAQAGAAYSQARQQALDYRSEGETYVRENPRQSLLTALFVGFILGLLMRR